MLTIPCTPRYAEARRTILDSPAARSPFTAHRGDIGEIEWRDDEHVMVTFDSGQSILCAIDEVELVR
jgi:hypothetical protein